MDKNQSIIYATFVVLLNYYDLRNGTCFWYFLLLFRLANSNVIQKRMATPIDIVSTSCIFGSYTYCRVNVKINGYKNISSIENYV